MWRGYYDELLDSFGSGPHESKMASSLGFPHWFRSGTLYTSRRRPGEASPLWFAKTWAETRDAAVLGRVVLNTIIASIQPEDSGGHEPECAWSAHV